MILPRIYFNFVKIPKFYFDVKFQTKILINYKDKVSGNQSEHQTN